MANNNNNNNNNNIYEARSNRSKSQSSSSSSSYLKLSAYQLEDRFCRSVGGGISWKTVKENQKYTSLYDNILKWNDSAAKEAFWDAKNRFLAALQGRPSHVNLPAPDIYIDNIDWNSTIDPELLSDLENPAPDNQDGGVIIGIPAINTSYDFTIGWGDAEDVKPREQVSERLEEPGWEDDYVYATQNRASGKENGVNGSSWSGYRKQQDYNGNGKGYNNKGDQGGWNTSTSSRYKISRFQQNSCEQSDNYRGCGRPLFTWKPVTRGF